MKITVLRKLDCLCEDPVVCVCVRAPGDPVVREHLHKDSLVWEHLWETQEYNIAFVKTLWCVYARMWTLYYVNIYMKTKENVIAFVKPLWCVDVRVETLWHVITFVKTQDQTKTEP